MSNNAINVRPVFRDSNGDPRVNGKIYFYENRTTTLATIYADEELTTAQDNPYTLDAYGRISGDVHYTGKLTVKHTNSDGSDPITDDDVSASISDDISVIQQYEVTETDPASMSVLIKAGRILSGTSLVSNAAQTTTTITAPSVNPRIDRIVVNQLTGVYSIITGSESASPSAPAITAGYAPLAQIALTTSTTSIKNADITDERMAGAVNTVNSNVTETLTNKTVDLTNNTLTGTLAEFNTSISDATIVGVSSGTWTPELSDSSSSVTAAGQTYGNQVGVYYIVGDLVYVAGYMSMTSLGTLSGNAYIHNIPESNMATIATPAIPIYAANISVTAGTSIIGVMSGGSDVIYLKKMSATSGGANMTCAEVTDSGALNFSFMLRRA